MTEEKPKGKKVFIPPELYQKLTDHAKQKSIKVDQEANDLLELSIKFYEAVFAVKEVSKGGDVEL
jgi:hypothetical protein